MKTLIRLKIFYLLCFLYKIFYVQYPFLPRVLMSLSILLVFFIVNSVCSIIVNIKAKIDQ